MIIEFDELAILPEAIFPHLSSLFIRNGGSVSSASSLIG